MAPPKQGTPILVRIPPDDLAALDEAVTAGDYDSRAELLREIIRSWRQATAATTG